MGQKKLPVCINVFPTLDYIELVQFNEQSHEIDKAVSLPCSFDAGSRLMKDRDQLAQTIRDLYSTSRIPMNTPTVLVLPSFFTREIDLPSEFSKDELRFALVSEAERFILFKKAEPQVDWVNLSNSHLLYSAYPVTEVEKYASIFQEQRTPLLAIDLNYFGILRGLAATGMIAEESQGARRWCLMVISDYSFFVSLQEGNKILKTTEAPLSTSNEDDMSSIQEIQGDFDAFSSGETYEKLVIINNSKGINSENLVGNFIFHGQLTLVDQNEATLRSRGSTDGQFPCSLEAIGGAFYSQITDVPRMNFVPKTGEDLVGIMYLRKQATNWLLAVNGVVFLLCLVLWGALSLWVWTKDNERIELSKQVSQLGFVEDPAQVSLIERKKFVRSAMERNVQLNNVLISVGTLSQGQLWLEKIDIDSPAPDQPYTVALEGRALNLQQVDEMKAQLNKTWNVNTFEVTQAEQVASPDGQTYFTWAIKNYKSSTPQ